MTTTIAPPDGADDNASLDDEQLEQVAGGTCGEPWCPPPIIDEPDDDSPIILVPHTR